MTQPANEHKGISKAFGPVQANKDISLAVQPGTIHGLTRQDGAGTSTAVALRHGF